MAIKALQDPLTCSVDYHRFPKAQVGPPQPLVVGEEVTDNRVLRETIVFPEVFTDRQPGSVPAPDTSRTPRRSTRAYSMPSCRVPPISAKAYCMLGPSPQLFFHFHFHFQLQLFRLVCHASWQGDGSG